MGHLDPSQGPPQLGVSCVDYKLLENKNGGRRKVIQATRTQMNINISLSLTSHYEFGVIPDLGEDLISLVCLVLNAIALVRCRKSENLDAMNGGWLGYL